MNQNTTVAPAPQRAVQNKIRTTLAGDYFKQQVAMCLPKHLTPERFIRMALTAIMRTPKLAECTEASVTKCMLTLSELGIEPDGRRAHLIPYENRKMGTVECTLILDWKGKAELVMRSGIISKLHADLICENDDFAYDLGDILHHRIDFKKSRGNPYAAYAMAVTKDGQKFVAVMTQAEIEKIRDGSQGWKAFKAGYAKQSPWSDAPGEMWKKTAFHRLSKWLPLSPEIQDSLEKDDVAPPSAAVITSELAIPTAIADAPEPEPIEVQGRAEQEQPPEAPEPPQEPSEPQNPVQTPPKPQTAPRGAAATAQSELEKCITEAQDENKQPLGLTFPMFIRWADGVGVIADATSYTMFSELKADDCKRLLRAKAGMIAGVRAVKEGQS